MSLPLYVDDILHQPQALGAALDHFDPRELQTARARLQEGSFDRVVLTGMGGSFASLYPAYLELAAALNLPVSWVETAELIHYFPRQLNGRTLLWAVSQSGRSAEIRGLVEGLPAGPERPFLLALTNEDDSVLARAADALLLQHAGAEATVSAKTYTNSLALNALAAAALAGRSTDGVLAGLRAAAGAAEEFLGGWRERVEQLKEQVGVPEKMVFCGRGPSLASAITGGLVMKEASKYNAEGMSTAWFRHGPLELSDERLVMWMFAGPEKTRALNLGLASDVAGHGAKVFWVGEEQAPGLTWLPLPAAGEEARPLLENLWVQMETIALAELRGQVPGQFRHLGKVVLVE